MAATGFGNSGANVARSISRTYARALDFNGRSDRTELVHYIVSLFLLGAILALASIAAQLPPQTLNFIAIPLLIPFPALAARRLQDQGRSGLLWFLLAALAFALDWLFVAPGQHVALSAAAERAMEWTYQLVRLAAFVLLLLPGSKGDNAYGPDPRMAAT